MSLGVVLDVTIGLTLTYLLLGLMATALQETVAVALTWRGKQLRAGVTSLFAGKNKIVSDAVALAEKVHGHPLVQGTSGNGLPSYISASSFSLALFDALADGSKGPVFSQIENAIAKLPDSPVRRSITALLVQAGGDLDKLKSSVEAWYSDAMDRLSGDYKRWSHAFALIFGLAVAVVFNVDSIHVASTLWSDPNSRAAVVAAAAAFADQKPDADPAKRLASAQQALDALPIPIGWNVPKDQTTLGYLEDQLLSWSGLRLLLGWLATALAVSLGAPFWFDTLQLLFNVRGAGPKPPPIRPADQTAS